jgi:hypothetical protein
MTGVIGFDTITINANGIDTSYFEAGVGGSNADLIGNAGGANLFLSSTNLPAGQAHSLRVETPIGSGAIIEHLTVGGPVRNLAVSTQGALSLTAVGTTINSGAVAGNVAPTTITNSNAGGQANPTLTLTNTNATGSVAMEVYKNKPTAGSNADVLFNQSVYGKDSGNAKQEYTRITHTIRDNIGGTEDGSIEFSAFRAGAVNTFIQINGVDNEVNVLKNLDMGGNSINTNQGDMTITTTTSANAGNMNITAKGALSINNLGGGAIFVSAETDLYLNSGTSDVNINAGSDVNILAQGTGGAGQIVLQVPDATGEIRFVGTNIQSGSAGGNSGQHLVIYLNGTQYKIKLETP